MPAKSKTSSKTSASIEDVKRLYIRAGAHSLTEKVNKESGLEQEVLYIEVFLLQATLLEGILVNLGLKLLENRKDLIGLKGKRYAWYGYDNAINDLYLLGAVNTEEFKKLEQFKAKRNEYIHNLLSENTDVVEGKVLRIYKEYDGLVWDMIQRLEKKVGKISEPST